LKVKKRERFRAPERAPKLTPEELEAMARRLPSWPFIERARTHGARVKFVDKLDPNLPLGGR
jgi:hypothetical protein